ncbi:hypothetical protein CLOLEP_02414 [[Clostridium] leptum DSM 753]|uniref:Uncharacterized protein n=1 Tax=[Clostridium] leptum DSM 753 TaxID=428125 RepID=A7VV08_9FIRM|nr:hypothetical protein CLOLEP_02414 [[Clostridium] leptum DSM 753]
MKSHANFSFKFKTAKKASALDDPLTMPPTGNQRKELLC